MHPSKYAFCLAWNLNIHPQKLFKWLRKLSVMIQWVKSRQFFYWLGIHWKWSTRWKAFNNNNKKKKKHFKILHMYGPKSKEKKKKKKKNQWYGNSIYNSGNIQQLLISWLLIFHILYHQRLSANLVCLLKWKKKENHHQNRDSGLWTRHINRILCVCVGGGNIH